MPVNRGPRERPENRDALELQAPTDFLVDRPQYVRSQCHPHVIVVHQAHQVKTDHQGSWANLDDPVKSEGPEMMGIQDHPDHKALQVPPENQAVTEPRARVDVPRFQPQPRRVMPASMARQVLQVHPETKELLAATETPDKQARKDHQVLPVHQEPVVIRGRPDPRARQVQVVSAVFAPSTARWMVAFSSRMARDVNNLVWYSNYMYRFDILSVVYLLASPGHI